MNRFLSLVCGLAMVVSAVTARAETWTLQLKRTPSPTDGGEPFARGMLGAMLGGSSQSFFLQIQGKGEKGVTNPAEQEFTRIVKKQPKYQSSHPLRAVAHLGSQSYAFVLDTKDDKAKEYSRLYFDFNNNGDLTDDRVIEGKGDGSFPFGVTSQFPRVDLTIQIDGAKLDYSFLLFVYSQSYDEFKYVSASLTSAAYREGDITLEGKKHHIIIVDHNSNGRFDDAMKVDGVVQTDEGIYPQFGDMLVVDAEMKEPMGGRFGPLSPSQHYLSKLVPIDGRYYDLKVSPAGERLTLTPSAVPLGQVTTRHEGFQGAIFGEKGYITVTGDRSKPMAVPAGEWRLLSYTINRTGWKEPSKSDEKNKGKPQAESQGGSLFGALLEAITGSAGSAVQGPRPTTVSAQGTSKCQTIQVGQGQTVELPFGPPYKPVVKASTGREPDKVQLQLSLVGLAGDTCNDLTVNGGRPEAPAFTITDPKGEVVERGTFKYG